MTVPPKAGIPTPAALEQPVDADVARHQRDGSASARGGDVDLCALRDDERAGHHGDLPAGAEQLGTGFERDVAREDQHAPAADVERPGRSRQDERRRSEVEDRAGFHQVGGLQPARIGDRVAAEVLRRRRMERRRRRSDDDEREDGESQRGALPWPASVVPAARHTPGTFVTVNATNVVRTAELRRALYAIAGVRHDARP
jgi:hypothetical protein